MSWKKGYSKAHPGKYAVIMDWETTGSTFGGDSSVLYQGIAFAALVVETDTWTEVDSLYRELHFDDTKYQWTEGAERIHGLSREHLAENGVSREEALADLLELLLKYFTPGSKILFAGHNASFDNDFTSQLFSDFEMGHVLNFHHVTVDTSGIAFALIGEYKSDVVFELLGGIAERKQHSALEDARACLAVLHNIKKIFAAGLAAPV